MTSTIKFLSLLAAFIMVATMLEVTTAVGKVPTCYQETFGTRSGILHCSAHDSKYWLEPHDTKFFIRCPEEGVINGRIVFAEMESCITSTEHQLKIVDGGIGMNYILMQLEANNTILLDYRAKFYII